jgi:hypothetical protein
MSAPRPGLVARWTTRRPPAAGSLCDECATVLVDVACQRCGQLAGEAVGMLATVVDAGGELRIVIAQRTGKGDWTPIRTMSATAEAVRSLVRPDATGPTARATSSGGLW